MNPRWLRSRRKANPSLFRYASHFIFCLLLRTEKAIKCNRKIVLIGWYCKGFHSTASFHSFSWSLITQSKLQSFIPRFRRQKAECSCFVENWAPKEEGCRATTRAPIMCLIAPATCTIQDTNSSLPPLARSQESLIPCCARWLSYLT